MMTSNSPHPVSVTSYGGFRTTAIIKAQMCTELSSAFLTTNKLYTFLQFLSVRYIYKPHIALQHYDDCFLVFCFYTVIQLKFLH